MKKLNLSSDKYSEYLIKEYKKYYDKFVEKSKGKDPDFPLMDFGNSENTYKASNNVTRIDLAEEARGRNIENNDPFML